jgi:hypothetical protein
VFTTTKFNKSYESILPAEYIHSQYNPEALQSLLDIQKSTGRKHRAFVIFDDCLPQTAFKSQLFLDLCTTFRHYNLTVILSVQYLFKVPSVLRECTSRVAIFRNTTKRSVQGLFECFGGWFDNYKQFQKFVMDNTGDYKFIWYIANSSSDVRADVYQIKKCPARIPAVKYEY